MNRLTLTNYRVRFSPNPDETGGEKRIISIMLEHISSSTLCSVSQPALLIIGGLLFIAGLLGAAIAPQTLVIIGILGIVLGVILGGCYFLTRQNQLLISSPTISICCRIEKKSFGECEELLDKIENAINNRYLSRTFTSQAYRAG